MHTLVMGLNYGIDEKENIEKKKNTLMEYLRLHIKVSICIKKSIVKFVVNKRISSFDFSLGKNKMFI